MNNLQKACLVLILITVIGGSGISAQEGKNTPNKENTPKVKVKDKDDNKQQDRNRDNKDRENDKGNKKPGI